MAGFSYTDLGTFVVSFGLFMRFVESGKNIKYHQSYPGNHADSFGRLNWFYLVTRWDERRREKHGDTVIELAAKQRRQEKTDQNSQGTITYEGQ